MAQKRKLTIVCVGADLIPDKLGGAEKHAIEVINRLAKTHKILLFVGSDTSIKTFIPKTVEIFPVVYPKIPNLFGISYIIFGFFQIRRILAARHFDLLWAKQTYPQAPLAVLLKMTLKRPVYVTAQNPMLHQEELVIKGKVLVPLQRFLAGLLTPLISWSLSRSDVVAAVSNYSANLAKKMGAKKVVIIPNGVDLSRFKPKPRSKIKKFTIVTTSSLIPRNGVDTLIDAVALLSKDIDWQLLIAGDGPKELSLKAQSLKLKLTNKIKFLGRVNNSKIPQLLAKADIFVRPSRQEGFGVSFLEALAAGVPVIATPVGGILDFIHHKKTGLLVTPDDPKELKDAIELLIQNNNLKRSLVKNGIQLVNKKYHWKKIASQIEAQFYHLINQ